MANLQQKLEHVQATNALMKEDLAIAKNTILALQQENRELLSEKELAAKELETKIQVSLSELHTSDWLLLMAFCEL